MFKNVASQKIKLFAFDSTTGVGKTGDAANLTAYVSKDNGSVTVLGDTSATEMDATNAKGWYLFDLTQAETNADSLLFTGKSSTSNIQVNGQIFETFPASFTSFVTPTNLTAAQIATGVWQDTTAGDFTTALSVGKSVMNGVALGTGLTVAAVSGAVGSVTGAVGSVTGAVGSVTGAVGSVTGNVGGNVVGSVASVTAGVTVTTNNDKTGYALTSPYDFAKGTVAMTESYAANGVAPTPVQALMAIHQDAMQFTISGTSYTVKKLDAITTAFIKTLNDATTPTAVTR